MCMCVLEKEKLYPSARGAKPPPFSIGMYLQDKSKRPKKEGKGREPWQKKTKKRVMKVKNTTKRYVTSLECERS